jgi:hypothetical protein
VFHNKADTTALLASLGGDGLLSMEGMACGSAKEAVHTSCRACCGMDALTICDECFAAIIEQQGLLVWIAAFVPPDIFSPSNAVSQLKRCPKSF